jgi:hypothetical protein
VLSQLGGLAPIALEAGRLVAGARIPGRLAPHVGLGERLMTRVLKDGHRLDLRMIEANLGGVLAGPMSVDRVTAIAVAVEVLVVAIVGYLIWTVVLF